MSGVDETKWMDGCMGQRETLESLSAAHACHVSVGLYVGMCKEDDDDDEIEEGMDSTVSEHIPIYTGLFNQKACKINSKT